MRGFLIIGVVFLVIAGIFGLARMRRGGGVSNVPLPPVEEPAPPPSAKLDVSFYVDASAPMRGFLAGTKEGQKNYFVELLDHANGILRAGWKDVAVEYFRFGRGEPKPIPSIRDFRSEKPFTETGSFIDSAIRHETKANEGRQQLKIILTDLFQNDSDSDRLAVELNDRYLKDAQRAVGILAVRNVFDGAIDDLPGMAPKGAADSLPFYLVIVGQNADVRHCIGELTRELVVSKLPRDRWMQVVYAQRQVERLNRPLAIRPAGDRPGFTRERTKVPSAQERGIEYLVANRDFTAQLTNLPKDDLNKIGPHIRVGDPVEKSAFQVNNGRLESVTDKVDAFKISGDSLEVQHSKLLKNRVYLFSFDLMGDRSDFPGLEDWGLESSDVRRILGNKAFDQAKDGARPGKTPNLRHFLQTMASKMYQSKIRLARFYFYVQAN